MFDCVMDLVKVCSLTSLEKASERCHALVNRQFCISCPVVFQTIAVHLWTVDLMTTRGVENG